MGETVLDSVKRKGSTVVSVYLLFRRGEEVCLSLRKNTGYNDGRYGLIAGHVEDGESARAAMVREALEEAGLELKEGALRVVHVMHRKTDAGRLGMEVFFICDEWAGKLENREPHKCERLAFYPINQLPENTIFYVADAIQMVDKGQFYSERGWS